jgi:hypothetical protein
MFYLTVAQAATIINALFTVVHQTLGMALALVLIYLARSANPAIVWSHIVGRLHSSYWPALLRADSSSLRGSDSRLRFIFILTVVSTVLLATANIVTPLGLKPATTFRSPRIMSAIYAPDTSPMGLATPTSSKQFYGRICGAFSPIPCPGNDTGNTTQIAPSIMQTFTSTPHGPFNMLFRRYFLGTAGYDYPATLSQYSLLESFVLDNGTFATEGLIVSMTDTPGVGFWNFTLPSAQTGGNWSEEVLWLEPVTSCVNTNLTIDYRLGSDPYTTIETFNVTDRGGLYNFTSQYPEYSRDGQNIDLQAHAYKGAVIHNLYFMLTWGITPNKSYDGRAFPLNESFVIPGILQYLGSGSLLNSTFNVTANATDYASEIDISCQGYGGQDNVNTTNVSVHCSLLLGPPQRTDGGDSNLYEASSQWQQALHMCSSSMRVKLQNVTFSYEGPPDLTKLEFTRQDITDGQPPLWAMEKTDIALTDVDAYWGHVDDSYENDPNLWTVRANQFYVPAGASDLWGVVSAGQPNTVPAASWTATYGLGVIDFTSIYSGEENYAVLRKWQAAINEDAEGGPAKITNMIWTDLVANNMIGSDTRTTLLVSPSVPGLAYDYRYGVPAFMMLAIWAVLLAFGVVVVASGRVRLASLRVLLNHTSAGRIILGHSVLRPCNPEGVSPTSPGNGGEKYLSEELINQSTAVWSKTAGQTVIAFRKDPVSPLSDSTDQMVVPVQGSLMEALNQVMRK